MDKPEIVRRLRLILGIDDSLVNTRHRLIHLIDLIGCYPGCKPVHGCPCCKCEPECATCRCAADRLNAIAYSEETSPSTRRKINHVIESLDRKAECCAQKPCCQGSAYGSQD